MTRQIVLAGSVSSFCVPEVLYHGTWSEAADGILKHGLRHDAGQPQSMASCGANYLTTSLSMAASIARSRASRHGSAPRVIAVESNRLDPDWLSFDLNMCGRYWSESVAYGQPIPVEALRLAEVDVDAVPNELMLLDEPTPGERPLVFNLDWSRAQEFMAATQEALKRRPFAP